MPFDRFAICSRCGCDRDSRCCRIGLSSSNCSGLLIFLFFDIDVIDVRKGLAFILTALPCFSMKSILSLRSGQSISPIPLGIFAFCNAVWGHRIAFALKTSSLNSPMWDWWSDKQKLP